MITLHTNLTQALAPLQAKLAALQPGGTIYGDTLHTVATELLDVVRTRIHVEGKAADGSSIRQGGADGETLYKSGGLKNELKVLQSSGGYGLGWNDSEKLQRAATLEARYGKKIWALTEDELSLATEVAQNEISNAILK